MKDKIISTFMVIMLCLSAFGSIGVSAGNVIVEHTFSADDDYGEISKEWTMPSDCSLDDDGLFHQDRDINIIYTGNMVNGKYEYSATYRAGYSGATKVYFNYIDNLNYYFVEISPSSGFKLKTYINGSTTVIKSGNVPVKFSSATDFYTARIVCNGGDGVSLYFTVGSTEYTVFENAYISNNPFTEGFVGFSSFNNPLTLKSVKVVSLGEADFVKPAQSTDDNAEVSKPEEKPQSVNVIEEIDESLYDLKAYKTVCSLGILPTEDGVGGKLITAEEFETVVNKICGTYTYDQNKILSYGEILQGVIQALGYDNVLNKKINYIAQANSLKLLEGVVEKDFKKPLNRYDFARVIYNALDVPVMSYNYISNNSVSFYTDENVTFLTEKLNMEKISGMVTDNGISALTSDSLISMTKISIGELTLDYPNEYINRQDILGRYVEVYYDRHTDKILYLQYDEKEKIEMFNAAAYSKYENSKIYYENDKKKTKSINILPTTYLIYNGTYLQSYNESTFELDNGKFTAIMSNDGNNDVEVLIVDSYKDFAVAKKSEDKLYNIMYDTQATDGNKICLVDYYGLKQIYIYDTDENAVEFEKIEINDILSIRESRNMLEITVCKDVVRYFDITEMYEENGKTYISDGENEYRISKSYERAKDSRLYRNGQTVTLYLNMFNDVSYSNFVINQEYDTGILLDSSYDQSGIKSKLELKIYETDGEFQIFSVGDRVRMCDEDGNISTVKQKKCFELLNGRNDLITYFVDDNDVLKYIELPYNGFSKTCDNRYKLICDFSEENSTHSYSNSQYSFGNEFFLNDSASIYTTRSQDIKDFEGYAMLSKYSLINAVNYKFKAYSLNSDMLVDFLLVYDYQNSLLPTLNSLDAVVTDIKNVITDDGDEITRLHLFNGSDVTVECEDGVENRMSDMFTVNDAEKPVYTVKEGDIIRYTQNLATGIVENIILIYRNDILAPDGTNGWFPGCNGSIADALNKTNPYLINSSYVLQGGAASPSISWGYRRYLIGFAARTDGGIVEITTKNLHAASQYEYSKDTSDGSITQRCKLKNAKAVIKCIYNRRSVTATAASAGDIETFEEAANQCNKIILSNGNGATQLFIITNE